MRPAVAALVVMVISAACGGAVPAESSPGDTPASRATRTPEQAVAELVRALAEGDHAAATELTVDGQMVLVALAEGVTVQEALTLRESGAGQVGANFWSGFTDGIADFLGRRPSDLRVGEVSRFLAGGREFARVDVAIPLDGTSRHFLVRNDQGWKVDVIATFASALAGKLAESADAVRSNSRGGELLELMREQVPSLEAVLEDPGTGPDLQQAVVSAIAAISR